MAKTFQKQDFICLFLLSIFVWYSRSSSKKNVEPL